MVLSEGPDPESIGCGFNAFKEIEEVNALIKELRVADLPFRNVEKNREQFKYILTQYQDQPHLLDPHMENILSPMLEIVKNENISDTIKHNVFKYLAIVMSVKTYKKTVTYLPHEVQDLMPVLRMLEKQDSTDNETWETRYVLLIWLSIISKIPFPLSRLEIEEQEDQEKTIIFRIVRICQLYCFSKDSCSTAAVFLIANFLTRSDVKKLFLEEMIMWCLKCLEEDSSRHGSLAVLASMLKHCAREDLKPYTQKLLDSILKIQLNDIPDVLVRKFAMKVVQRIGFVLLRTKLASWRYQLASKPISLVSSVPKTTISEVVVDRKKTEMVSEIDEEDIPPAIEDVIEFLIQGMRDKAIIIRWSAAKGIGRITARLPVDLADDVVGFVLNLFSGRESDSAWHGGCLALAELGRRGLLLPHRLKDVIPPVLQALVFDEPRAYGSVGSIIRDAACYVCWSFARAFEPHIFLPHVKAIAATLLTVTCFDREINCRRAASAAFQENVGRQGNFPHGIDIFTAADYFEVGVRSNAFLKISVHIAQFDEYIKPLIDHLLEKKVNHWDTSIRELAAKALHNLTSRDPHYMVEKVIPSLLDMVDSIDLNVRHGSVMAIGEIIEALYIEYNDEITITIGESAVERIKKIVSTFKIRGHFKGLGGELMKQACATFIKKCAIIHFPVHSTEIVADWQDLLEESLSHEVFAIRSKAAESHTEFFAEYYTDKYIDENARNVIINRYLGNLQSVHQTLRIGFAQAIGHFPLFVVKDRAENIIEALIACTKITDETAKWSESRKQALHSLTMICQTLGVANSDTWKQFVNQLYDCYLLALQEYTTDSRGDIGAWVREAAITAINVLTNLVSQANLSGMLTETLMANMVGGIAQQAVERIDKIRAEAGVVFGSLIHSDPQLPNIPYHAELKTVFPAEECKDINWRQEEITFPRFVKMLNFPPYMHNLLRGMIFSVGGVTESLVKHASFSLFSYLKEIDENALKDLCDKILKVCEESHKNERMISSILAFLDRLLSSGSIQSILDDSESEIPGRILDLLKKEMKVMHNTAMITSSIKVVCQLLQVRGPVGKKAFAHLSLYLCNKFKYLRKTTATRTYEALTLYGEDMDLSEDDLMALLTSLNDTDWEKPVEELRPIRNHFCELMKVPAPTIQTKAKK